MSIIKTYPYFLSSLILLCSINLHAQKSLTSKAIRPYIMPMYSINKSGVEKDVVYNNHDSNGVNQSRSVSDEDSDNVPATIRVKNNFNFAAGLDYELWLPKRFFLGIGAEFRTLNNTVQYEYNFDKFIPSNSSFLPPNNQAFGYKQRLNLLSLSLHIGKNFRINNREFEVRVGASAPFNLNKIGNYDQTNGFVSLTQNGNDYNLPYASLQTYNFNRKSVFLSEVQRIHFYVGSNKVISIFPKKRTRISYGLQLNILSNEDRSMRFYTYYDYSLAGQNVYYKNQLTKFSYTKVPDLCLKLGLEF